MTRKTLAVLLAVIMIAAFMSGCAKESGENETRTFTVGFDAEFPPYGYINDSGAYDGFDLALAAEVCDRLGWELKLQPIIWDSKDGELESGNIDCIWNGFTRSEARENQYEWTVPYVDNSQVFVVKADSGITSVADLKDKTVMTQAGSSALDALESDDCADLRNSFKELLEVADYVSGFMELDSGAVDALAMDIGVANFQIAARGGGFTILDEEILNEVYAVGFLLGESELMYTVQGVLIEMAYDGTMLEIAQDYVDRGLVLDSLCLIG